MHGLCLYVCLFIRMLYIVEQMAIHDEIKENANSYHLQHVVELEGMAVQAATLTAQAVTTLDRKHPPHDFFMLFLLDNKKRTNL